MTVRSLIALLLLLQAISVPADESENLTFHDLFLRPAMRQVALSDNGEFIAYFRDYMLVMGKPDAGYSEIRQFHNRLSIQDVTWIGPSAVWVESWDPNSGNRIGTAIRFTALEEGGYGVAEVFDHGDPGYISDTLPGDNDRIVLARPKFEDNTLSADLYAVNVFDSLDDQLKKKNRIDAGSEDFFYYQRNSNGDITLGIRISEGVPEIWRRSPGDKQWRHVWTADKEATFEPWKISDDARTLWVLSDVQSDRVVASAFDLDSGEFGEVLYAHDRVDVEAILMDGAGNEPIGVNFTEQGLLRYHYFSEKHEAEFDRLRSYFPEMSIMQIGYSDVSDTRVIFASSPSDRGSVHICSAAPDHCDLVESIAPWLDGKGLSETIAFDVQSTDSTTVEAFLTMPSNGGDDIPLIALPHGGPIGISDDRYFSAEVQWFALNGYAVLQVNYRGSGGYGEKFARAGLRQWGRGIEDDIEASVRKAITEHPQIDGDRVGIFGGSYGGYSAIMSVIRNPELFKCAASFAGVMDLTLLFTQSTRMRNESLRDKLIEYVGDPDVDYAEQIEHSPVYRYKDIHRPVLLGHGLEDSIVDFEHSWRLHKMMSLNGSKPDFILLKKVGHGFDYVSEAKEFYDPLLEFLDEHLKQGRVITKKRPQN